MKLDEARRKWLTVFAPLIIWTILTLGLGSGLGSMNETSRVIRPLLELLFPTSDAETITFYHGIIRKFAHVFQYGVLGVLAVRAARAISVRSFFALLFVVAIAIADEVNQAFNPARTSSAWDVALDTVGGILGISIYLLFSRRRSSVK